MTDPDTQAAVDAFRDAKPNLYAALEEMVTNGQTPAHILAWVKPVLGDGDMAQRITVVVNALYAAHQERLRTAKPGDEQAPPPTPIRGPNRKR